MAEKYAMGIVRSFFTILLSSLLLSHAVLADMAAPGNAGYEPYSVRPDITSVQATSHPELEASWQNLRRAHVEAVAQLIESYPDRELYFLARDGEYLYDLAKSMAKEEPDVLRRLHLLNISRANMRAEHVKEYLEQEGISEAALRAGKKVMFVDTGFSGTIPNVIQSYFPSDLHPRLQTHLISSSNPAHPSSRAFLTVLNPAAAQMNPGSMHGTIISYEHMPRYTDRSDRFEKIDGRWEPLSKIKGAEDGTVSREKATAYREDLVAYGQSKEGQSLLRSRRLLWRQLRKLNQSGKTEELKKTLRTLAGATGPRLTSGERAMREAIVRDFIETEKSNGSGVRISLIELGLTEGVSDIGNSNKLELMTKFPQWKAFLEDPVTEIPKLLLSKEFATLGAMVDAITDDEFLKILVKEIGKLDPTGNPLLVKLSESIFSKEKWNYLIAKYVLSQPHWKAHPELVEKLIVAGSVDATIAKEVLSQPHWQDHPELVEKLIVAGKADYYVAKHVLSQPHWKKHPELVEKLVAAGTVDEHIVTYILSQPHWKDHPEWVEKMIVGGKVDEFIAQYVLSQPHWKDHPEWVEKLIAGRKVDEFIAQYVLSQSHWKDHPEWVEKLIAVGKVDKAIAQYVLSQPHWKAHPELVEKLIATEKVDAEIAQYLLSEPHWKDHPEWVEKLIAAGNANEPVALYVLTKPHWKDHPELVEKFIITGKADYYIAGYVLTEPQWKDHPELVEKLIAAGTMDYYIAQYVLSLPHWKGHPELVEKLITIGIVDTSIARYVLSQSYWKNDPRLRALCGGQEPTVELIRAGLQKEQAALQSSKPAKTEEVLSPGPANLITLAAITPELKEGDTVETKNGRELTVVKHVEDGRRGRVYQVRDKDGKLWALKVAKDSKPETLESLAEETQKAELYAKYNAPHAKIAEAQPTYVLKEWIDGVRADAWMESWSKTGMPEDAPQLQMLRQLINDLSKQGVYIGDLNRKNLIWNNGTWMIIDSGGIQEGLTPEAALSKYREKLPARWTKHLDSQQNKKCLELLLEALIK